MTQATPNLPTTALTFSEEDKQRYKRLHAQTHTADELEAFFRQCERTQLDPWSRQIYTLKRRQFVDGQSIEKAMTQVSIDGLRLQAERSGQYRGQNGPWWCGKDGAWVDVWTKPMGELVAAKVGVFREGWSEPIWGVARFDAYAQKKSGGALTKMWETMGDVMIAKCAEALALRKACPAELSGLYTTEEMLQADGPEKETTTTTVPQEQPKAPAAPKASAPKAEPKTAPAEAPKPVPVAAPAVPRETSGDPANVDHFDDVRADIATWTTPEKAMAALPAIFAFPEPLASAAKKIFREHRIKMQWEIGKRAGAPEGHFDIRPMAISEWKDLKRAQLGMEIIRAMSGDAKAEAISQLEVHCHEMGWTLDKVKLEVSKQ